METAENYMETRSSIERVRHSCRSAYERPLAVKCRDIKPRGLSKPVDEYLPGKEHRVESVAC